MLNEKQVLTILQKSLDASWLKNNLISNNIANVDTPNYKAYEMEFESLLKKAIQARGLGLQRTDSKHFPSGGSNLDTITPRISRDKSKSARIDGNNVDIDVQTANLANNAIKYQALADQLSAKLSRLKTVINEGRR